MSIHNEDKMKVKFILRRMKLLTLDAYGRPRYEVSLDHVMESLFGIRGISKKFRDTQDNQLYFLLRRLGVEPMMKLCNTDLIYRTLSDMVSMDMHRYFLSKKIKDRKRKKKNTKALREESEYMESLYKKAVKQMKRTLGIQKKETSYKKKYSTVKTFVEERGGRGDFFDDLFDEDEYDMGPAMSSTFGFEDDDRESPYQKFLYGQQRGKKSPRNLIDDEDDEDDDEEDPQEEMLDLILEEVKSLKGKVTQMERVSSGLPPKKASKKRTSDWDNDEENDEDEDAIDDCISVRRKQYEEEDDEEEDSERLDRLEEIVTNLYTAVSQQQQQQRPTPSTRGPKAVITVEEEDSYYQRGVPMRSYSEPTVPKPTPYTSRSEVIERINNAPTFQELGLSKDLLGEEAEPVLVQEPEEETGEQE